MKRGLFMTICGLFLAFYLNAQSNTPPSVSEPEIVKRTISRMIEKTIDGKKWELTLKDDAVTEVKLNGKKIPQSAWSKYPSEIDNLRASAYDILPDSSTNEAKESISKEQEILISDTGDLTPEQKATHNAIEDEMLNDKLIKNRFYQLVLTEKSMTVNGKPMPKETVDKYIIIYYTYSGEQRYEGCRFKIQVNKLSK